MAKRKAVSGCDYAEDDEDYIKKQRQAARKQMKTAGIAKNLKKAEKQEGYSKKPRVKAQKKTAKLTKVY